MFEFHFEFLQRKGPSKVLRWGSRSSGLPVWRRAPPGALALGSVFGAICGTSRVKDKATTTRHRPPAQKPPARDGRHEFLQDW